jgi:hypothetical protein
LRVNRKIAVTVATLSMAGGAAATTAAAPASAATTPQIGVGTSLANPLGSYPVGPHAYIGGDIGDAPGSSSTLGTAPLAPGSVTSWRMAAQNTGTATETISLLTEGSPTGALGLYAGGPTAQPQNAASLMTSVSTSTITLTPGAYAFPTVTVRVPAHQAAGLLPEATVWAYVAGTAPKGGGITMAAASGVREYLNIN